MFVLTVVITAVITAVITSAVKDGLCQDVRSPRAVRYSFDTPKTSSQRPSVASTPGVQWHDIAE